MLQMWVVVLAFDRCRMQATGCYITFFIMLRDTQPISPYR